MEIQKHRERPFDRDVPIHNWYYPLAVESLPLAPTGVSQFLELTSHEPEVLRALYLHVPFCETICSFCPFVRESVSENDLIDSYFNHLLLEMQAKSRFNSNKINSIFVGGGTPSLLSARQIFALGEALYACFDLSELREFSFEMEVKSVTVERLAALKSIGVTNVRIGVQTLQESTRKFFNLTASSQEAKTAVQMMLEQFSLVSVDMLYAYDGQTLDDLKIDIAEFVATGVPLIDFYPLNPVVSQTRLHREARRQKLRPPTATMRHDFWVVASEILSESGFIPHNGHGFIRVGFEGAGPTTNPYHFDYHEHVYGYKTYEILVCSPVNNR